MPSNFPSQLDSFSNPSGSATLLAAGHSTLHGEERDAIEALEAKVGIDGSAETTSHDYKLSAVTASNKAVASDKFQVGHNVAGTHKINVIDAERYAIDAGGDDTYAITLSPAPSAYAAGMMVSFTSSTGNTGASTLNVNSLGSKTIKKHGSYDLETGDILASQVVTVIYDGTNFQLISSPFRSNDLCVVRRTSALSINNNSDTAVTFTATDIYDPLALHDTSTNPSRITVARAGIYRITSALRWADSATGDRLMSIRVNNSTITPNSIGPLQSNRASHSLVVHQSLAASDYVEIFAFQNSGGSLNVDAADFSVELLAIG